MRNWKISMPKDAPREGMSHFAFSVKEASGDRVEFIGQADKAEVRQALKILVEASKTTDGAS